MSGEQLTAKDLNKTPTGHFSKRVDINNLLAKVREEKNKEKKWPNILKKTGRDAHPGFTKEYIEL